MYKPFKLLFLLSVCFILVSCNNSKKNEINMYLAASLSNQIESSIKNYDDVVNIDSSGSYDLVNKIILGAKPELVLLANYNLKNSIDSFYEFYGDYSYNKIILVHNNVKDINLNEICINNYEIGIADPKRAPLGMISTEILKENKCSANDFNLRVSSNAASLINMVNLGYLDFALIYESDFSKIKEENKFSYSAQSFDKDLIYSFYVNNDLDINEKKNVIKFINYLKSQENKLFSEKSE